MTGLLDVIVIGAGAAGLAATRALREAGLQVATLEARDRIGGRAWTESSTFGFPFDRGCHWLHSAKVNPWVGYGEEHGFSMYADPDGDATFVGGAKASEGESDAFFSAYQGFVKRVAEAADRGVDAPLSDYLDMGDPWALSVAGMVTHGDFGKPLEEVSTLTYPGHDDYDDNWFCKEGFGALVAHYGRNLAVELGAPVRRIAWGGQGVSVETSIGVLAARAVVVTATTGALAAEKIRFDPVLPPEKVESFHAFPMGLYNHIALLFSHDVLELGPDAYVYTRVQSDEPSSWISNVGGTGLTLIWVGGSLASDLEKAPVESALEYGLDRVAELAGNSARAAFIQGDYTRWGQDPWTLGSYGSLKPGAAVAGERLRRPVGDRIFFAGDMCHEELSGSCAGAFVSGLEAAKQVIRRLRREAGRR